MTPEHRNGHVYAVEGGRYAITDPGRALNSLRLAQGTEWQGQVEAAVYARFPELKGKPLDFDTQRLGEPEVVKVEEKGA